MLHPLTHSRPGQAGLGTTCSTARFPAHKDPFQPQPRCDSVKTHIKHHSPAEPECLFPPMPPHKGPGPAEAGLGPPYLRARCRRRRGPGHRVVPPGQGGTEPLDLAEVDEEGALGAVHTKESIAGVRGPAGPHPLQGAKKHVRLMEEVCQPCQLLLLWKTSVLRPLSLSGR